MTKKTSGVLDDNVASGVIDHDSADIIRKNMGAQIKDYEALKKMTMYNPAWGQMEVVEGEK